jgi:hypothetical protein
MQNTMERRAELATVVADMAEYLGIAEMQTESLLTLVQTLCQGQRLSLSAWHEAFEASQRLVEHIHQALDLAQEVFDEHEVLIAGSLSEDLTCDEFQCLTWK